MRSLAVRAAGEPRQELTSFASVAPSGRSQVDRVPSCRLETIFFSERFRTTVSS